MLGGSQRELTFHLNIQGGELANSNVDKPNSYLIRGGMPTLRLYPAPSGASDARRACC